LGRHREEPADGAKAVPYRELLQAAAPPGLTILEITAVDAHAPTLQKLVVSAEYEAILLDPVDEAGLALRLSGLLEAPSLPRERRGKSYDLRPLIEALSLTPVPLPSPLPPLPPGEGRGEGVRLLMRLAAREGATGRPEEVLDALGIPLEGTRIERTRLVFSSEIPAAVSS